MNYFVTISLVINILEAVFAEAFDKFGPNGISNLVKNLTNKAVKFQSGYIYDYAFVMLIGLSALITYLILN